VLPQSANPLQGGMFAPVPSHIGEATSRATEQTFSGISIQALLARGQPIAAIEKFTLANQKGPQSGPAASQMGEALVYRPGTSEVGLMMRAGLEELGYGLSSPSGWNCYIPPIR
jgi:hypothetical protein